DSHDPYRVSDIAWPALDAASRARLTALPIWEEAVRTEAMTAQAVLAMGRAEGDPRLAEAIRLQGYEEARHAELLEELTRQYGIPVPPHSPAPPPDPACAFMRLAYPPSLPPFLPLRLLTPALPPAAPVRIFEPVMPEEGRPIIFHVNWVAYSQARLPYASRPSYVFRRGLAMWLQLVSRVKTARQVQSAADGSQDNFTMTAHASFGDISARGFIQTGLRENERRLAPYDERLLPPALLPPAAPPLPAPP